MPSTQPRDGPLAASAATGSSRERTRWCWPGPVRPQHAVRPTPGCRWTCRPPKAAGTGPGNGCGSRSAPSADWRQPDRPGRVPQIFSGADRRRPHSPRSTGRALLAAPVVVVQPHDVILAEVVAVLHFDEDQRILAGVVDPMRHPDGNIDGLTRPDRDHLAVKGDGALAGHHEPVLRPAGMPLIAEPVAGRHGDRLDLVAGAVGQHSVGTPRTHVIVDHLKHHPSLAAGPQRGRSDTNPPPRDHGQRGEQVARARVGWIAELPRPGDGDAPGPRVKYASAETAAPREGRQILAVLRYTGG